MKTPRFTVAVFCGSRLGTRPEYLEAARGLGAAIGKQGGGLVYGGARIGLMGALADAALAAGAPVHGVLPKGLAAREIAHESLTRLDIVDSLHERKARMVELAQGFIAMPGGFGTLDEFFEVYTWRQIGLHDKPLGLLDTEGFFTPLLAFMHQTVQEGFVPASHLALLQTGAQPEALVERMFPPAG